jgi:hypothetical protein
MTDGHIQEYNGTAPCVLAEMYALRQIAKEVCMEEVDPLESLWKNANTRVVESFVLVI